MKEVVGIFKGMIEGWHNQFGPASSDDEPAVVPGYHEIGVSLDSCPWYQEDPAGCMVTDKAVFSNDCICRLEVAGSESVCPYFVKFVDGWANGPSSFDTVFISCKF